MAKSKARRKPQSIPPIEDSESRQAIPPQTCQQCNAEFTDQPTENQDGSYDYTPSAYCRTCRTQPGTSADPWEDLANRCESAAGIIEMLSIAGRQTNNIQVPGYKNLIEDLWERARWLGGLRNPSPVQPNIETKDQAYQAVCRLFAWTEVNRLNQAKTTVPVNSSVENIALAWEQLPPSDRKAYMSYKLAESSKGKLLEDQEAYDYLHEEGIPEDRGGLGELADYRLPIFGTWARQVRNARQILSEQKYTRRGRPATGRSIVKSSDIEFQHGKED